MHAHNVMVPSRLEPEHAEALYNTLLAALDMDPARHRSRPEAEQLLRAFENVHGYCALLTQIVSSPGLNEHARLLALLCILNTWRRHWRARGGGRGDADVSGTRILTDDEKAHLRTFLLSYMNETDTRLAKNLAHVLAKVVRTDWPRHWPDFFPALLSRLEYADELQTARVIYSLHKVTKELAGKVLLPDKVAFQAMVQSLFPVVYNNLWRPRMAHVIQALQSGAQGAEVVDQMQEVKTCSKILFFVAAQHAEVLELGALQGMFADIHASLEPLMAAHKALVIAAAGGGGCGALAAAVTKLTKTLAAIIAETQKRTPYVVPSESLLAFLHLFLDELESAASGEHADVLLWSRDALNPSCKFYLQACTFLSNCVSCREYQSVDEDDDETTATSSYRRRRAQVSPQQAEALRNAAATFCTPARLQALCSLVLQHLLGLRTWDLQAWLADPEEFILEEEQRKPEDDLWSAAEALFLSVFDVKRDLIAPNLAMILSEHGAQLAAGVSTTLSSELLYWDRVYLCMGLVSFSLRDYLDVPAWFNSCFRPLGATLVSDQNLRRPPVMLRRLVYLVACFVGDILDEQRVALYDFLITVLDPSHAASDLVVAIHALDALQALIGDWKFHKSRTDLYPFLARCMGNVLRVVEAAREMDNKKKAFKLMATVIETVDAEPLVPIVPSLADALRQVWAAADADTNLMDLRNGVMSVLRELVCKLGSESQAYHSLILPMVAFATDVSRPEHISLLEDGLALWVATTRHALALGPALTQSGHQVTGGGGMEGDLITLFPRLPGLLDRGMEHVRALMALLEDYITLGGAALMAQHGNTLSMCLSMAFTNVGERGTAYVTRAIEVLLVALPDDGARAMASVGVLHRVLHTCAAWVSKAPDAESDVVVVQHVSLLARVLLTAPGVASSVMEGETVDVCAVADVMMVLFDQVGSSGGVWRRKLWAMTLLWWYSGSIGGAPVVATMLQRLDQVLSIVLDVLAEMDMEARMQGQRHQEDARPTVHQVFTLDPQDEDDFGVADELPGGTALSPRLQALMDGDVVRTTDLRQYMHVMMEGASRMVGAEAFNAAVSKVDPVLLQQVGGSGQ